MRAPAIESDVPPTRAQVTGWGDGLEHPANYSVDNLGGAPLSAVGCIHTPNLHAHGAWDAAGTAFAIAYKSEMADVTMADLVVFSVAPKCARAFVLTVQMG